MININTALHKTDESLLKFHLKALSNLLENSQLGFHQLPQRKPLWSACDDLAQKLRKKFKTMVVLGIGGSSLGGKVIKDALKFKTDRKIIFWDNIDPLSIDAQLADLKEELNTICWAVISKSGNTIETITQSDYVNQFYKANNLKWTDHCVVITEPKKSPLSDFADAHRIPRLEVPLDVGGRFSVLTPVGMLPAAFLGLNINQFCEGAKEALQSSKVIADFSTQAEQSFNRGEWITVFWSYSDSLKEFGFWIQQLWAESLAKAQNRKGNTAPRASTPLPCVGPTDQHSILQQIADGAKDKFVVFMRHLASEKAGAIIKDTQFSCGGLMFQKSLGELLRVEAVATQMGLSQKKVSNITLTIPTITERELGFLFMFFELVVGTLGERMDINAFDQPGVELGKIIAKDLLSEK